MTTDTLRTYGIRRVYETTPNGGGGAALRLKDRMVELGPDELLCYRKLVQWLPTCFDAKSLEEEVATAGMTPERLARFANHLCSSGLLYPKDKVPAKVGGEEFYENHFAPALESWLSEAFSHPFWERMVSGRGSQRLFVGWLIELYHYTKNANRHMPLSVAYAHEKPIKQLRAKHYAEEWNHYHYFLKSLRHLGYSDEAVASSVPLPMTLALSNFMRQAAREDTLAYSICSAVLEGTTTDRKSFNPYHEKVIEMYGVPRDAVKPIYDHLDLDIQYQHSNLFLEILGQVDSLSAQRASRMLDYGHQLVEHIWMWTEAIERYYERDENPVPRRPFDPFLD